MTSKGQIAQLVDEAVWKRKRVTLKKDDDHQKKNCQLKKQFTKRFQNWYLPFVVIKTRCKFRSLYHHSLLRYY